MIQGSYEIKNILRAPSAVNTVGVVWVSTHPTHPQSLRTVQEHGLYREMSSAILSNYCYKYALYLIIPKLSNGFIKKYQKTVLLYLNAEVLF